HYYADKDGKELQYPVGAEGLAQIKKIVPTNVLTVWYTLAKFNHAAHRGVSCKECHDRAYADSSNPSTSNTDVLIPNMANCVQCHAPASRWWKASGGVRYDCAECHRYHHLDGTGPWESIGAAARDATEKRTILQFLTGEAVPRGK